MKINAAAISHARRFLLLLGLIVCISTLGSLYFDLNGIDKKYKTLAAELGRSFFQAIDAMRDWNLDRGGIYVELSKDAQPNPYLAEPLRTLTTADSKVLAMINHAHMTRLFSELLTGKRGIRLHISSLTPIRPENLADQWEKHVLAHFTQGSAEEFEIVEDGTDSVFRYMAALRVEERCLTCHPRLQDSPNHVRGGISVSFSYVPFREAADLERRRILLAHGIFLILGVGLIALTGGKMIQSIAAQQDALLQVKRLEGLLPICSSCKKIRLSGSDQRDQQSWIAVETYIRDRTDAEFTHGLCPQCAKELYPGFVHDRPR